MSALAIPYVPQRGYCKAPHSFMRGVGRKVSPIAFLLLAAILDDTVGQVDEPEWVHRPLSYWAYWGNCTEDAAMRALQELIRLNFIATRNAGRKREYKAMVANFGAQEVPVRPRRKIQSIRKPAGSVGIESQVEPISPPSEMPARPEQNHEVKTKVPDVEIGYLEEPSKFKVQAQGPFASVEEVREYLIESIAPKLGSLPVDSICQRTFEPLRTVPRGYFKNRVELRKNNLSGWGVAPLIALDVAQFHKAFTATQRSEVYDLGSHWDRVSELRRWFNSPETPEPVKNEITQMLPEWGAAPRRKKTRLEEIMDSI